MASVVWLISTSPAVKASAAAVPQSLYCTGFTTVQGFVLSPPIYLSHTPSLYNILCKDLCWGYWSAGPVLTCFFTVLIIVEKFAFTV